MSTELQAAAHAATEISSYQLWTAVVIFLATYGLILSERINRAIVALLGGGLMVLSGVMTQEAAAAAVDVDTIGLLLGMMILVAVLKESGVFQYMAIISAKFVKANPIGVLIVFSLVTAVFSGFLNNVTTVLLTTPVILLITRELQIKPYPFLFASILASNIGGTATLIGDPPNIMIASAAHLTFNQFLVNMAPIAIIVMVLTLLPIIFIYRKELVTTDLAKERIMRMNEKAAIKDFPLLIKSLIVMAFVIAGFAVGHIFNFPPATVALTGAAVLLLLDNVFHDHHKQEEKVTSAITEAEWVTLFFFAGLFVVVHALQGVGVIDWMANHMIEFTQGDRTLTIYVLLWGSAIVSALLDNIPFVATMIPMLQSMEASFGGPEAIEPMWWALALGACLGGNGSLIGASANLVVAGFADKAGHRISFMKFMVLAFPLMIMSIVISSIYVYFMYL